MLDCGALDGVRILSPATVRVMTTNQLAAMPEVPEEERRCRPWGLGWRLHWPAQSQNFGDLLGPRSLRALGCDRHPLLARSHEPGLRHPLHHAAAGRRGQASRKTGKRGGCLIRVEWRLGS